MIYKNIDKYFTLSKIPWLNGFRQEQSRENHTIAKDLILYMVILFFSSIILSWGPYYKPDHSVTLPFYWLSKWFFGLENVRAPGRFGMFIALPLGVFAVGFLRLTALRKPSRQWITILATILIVVESFPEFPVFSFNVDPKGIYQQVSQEIEPGTPLLELPIFGKDHIDTIRIILEQLDGSTLHWGKLIVGYGCKTTSEYSELLYLDNIIQQGSVEPVEAIKFGSEIGISDYLIHLDRYRSEVAEKWMEMAREPGWTVVFDTEDTLFMRFNDR